MTVVDALRGFSLAGIVIVHMVENYVGGSVPEEALAGANQGIADQAVNIFILLLLRGKFFALFSFLFGLSFFIQMESASRRQEDFRGKFFWRLCLLLGIGYVNHLFYRGDILTIYALLGMLLIPFYKVSTKWILILSGLLIIGLPRFLLFAMGAGEGLLLENPNDPDSPVSTAYYQVLTSGSLLDVFRSNAISGHLMKGEFQIGIFGRGYLTFAFFLLGLLIGRLGYFRNYLEFRTPTRRLLWISLAVFVAGTLLTVFSFMQLGPEPDFNTWWAMLGLAAVDIGNLGITGIILAGFMLLYQREKVERTLDRFAPYGRMALTNYFLQSILGTFVFYGWGLGYLGHVRNVYAFLLSLGVIALQMGFSSWWLKRFHYGPLEWAWRSLTHMRAFPLKRS